MINKLTINRAKWRSGSFAPETMNGIGDVFLLNEQGYRCCLGFFAQACGARGMKNKETPCELNYSPILKQLVKFNKDEYKEDTQLSLRAIDINDDENLTPVKREEKLTKLFSKHGIKLTFTGKYKNPKLNKTKSK